MSAVKVFQTTFVLLLLAVCVGEFVVPLPRRRGFAARAVTVGSGMAALWVVSVRLRLGPFSDAARIGDPTSQILTFTAALGVCFVIVLWLFDVTPWAALFCCTAGYTVQNLTSGVHWILASFLQSLDPDVWRMDGIPVALSFCAVSAASIAICYRVFARRMRGAEVERFSDPRIIAALAAVLVFEIFFEVAIRNIASVLSQTSLSVAGWPLELALHAIQLCTCLAVLLIQFEVLYNHLLRREARDSREIVHEQAQQQLVSRDALDQINAHLHDLQHQIDTLRSLDELDRPTLERLSQKIGTFGASVATGNELLDVILTEKSLLSWRDGIELTCVADGRCVSFMSSSELYALFGNAFDNALAAAGKCVEGGRFVSVTLRQVGQMAVAHVENGYVGEVEFEDGLPQTSEDGGLHGYGMRSIAATVERYDGTLSCAAVDGVFHLDVMIPLG